MTRHAELFNELLAPFPEGEVKTRPQGGRQLKYVTARTVMNRLDEAIGPENWWDAYEQSERSVVCKLTLRLPGGPMITKVDVGGHAGMQDEGDDEKSGFSDAFKRAAAKFGVGRYLYGDGVPTLRQQPPRQNFPNRVEAPPPQGSDPIPDDVDDGVAQADHGPQDVQPQGQGQRPWLPNDGRDLWGWAKKLDDEQNLGVVKFLMKYGRDYSLADRIVSWPQKPARDAYRAALNWLNNPQPAAPSRRNGRR